MEDALNNAALLHVWTDVQKMEYNAIMDLSLAQIAYLLTTINDDTCDSDTRAWRVHIINKWNEVNIR